MVLHGHYEALCEAVNGEGHGYEADRAQGVQAVIFIVSVAGDEEEVVDGQVLYFNFPGEVQRREGGCHGNHEREIRPDRNFLDYFLGLSTF